MLLKNLGILIKYFRRFYTKNYKIFGAGSASEERFWNVEVKVTLFTTCLQALLGRCATCEGSSHTKNEYKLFYLKLDDEYFFIFI